MTLVLVALACAAAWRSEVEWHGWAGLTWVGETHYAVPAGVVLFVAWTLTTDVAPREPRRRVALSLLGLGWGAVSLSALDAALRVLYGRWAVAVPPDVIEQWLVATVLAVLGVPVISFGLGRAAGAALRTWTLAPSVVLFALAIPLGEQVVGYLEPRLDVCVEHAVKTGAAIPFAVLGLGLPWVTARRAMPV